MIHPNDELQHPPGPEPLWRESHYFFFHDERAGLSGFSTMGFRPNEGLADAGFLLFRRRARLELAHLYPRRNVPFRGDWQHWTLGGLSYTMLDPLHRWTLCLEDGRCQAELTFSGFHPPFDYDYANSATALPPFVAGRHYEQGCTVSGAITLRGQRFDVRGVGLRDHSWGVRDWARPDEWKWITGVFPADGESPPWAFNVWRVQAGQEVTVNGFVFDGERTQGLVGAHIETEYAPDGRTQMAVRLRLEDAAGRIHHAQARSLTVFPMADRRTLLNEALAEFEMGERRGWGVLEYLWQADSAAQSYRWLARSAWHFLRARLR